MCLIISIYFCTSLLAWYILKLYRITDWFSAFTSSTLRTHSSKNIFNFPLDANWILVDRNESHCTALLSTRQQVIKHSHLAMSSLVLKTLFGHVAVSDHDRSTQLRHLAHAAIHNWGKMSHREIHIFFLFVCWFYGLCLSQCIGRSAQHCSTAMYVGPTHTLTQCTGSAWIVGECACLSSVPVYVSVTEQKELT